MFIQTSYTAARANLAKLCDQTVDDREIVIIKRRNGSNVALIAADELESMLETIHLYSSPRNAKRLLESLKQMKAKKFKPRTTQSLRDKFGLNE